MAIADRGATARSRNNRRGTYPGGAHIQPAYPVDHSGSQNQTEVVNDARGRHRNFARDAIEDPRLDRIA